MGHTGSRSRHALGVAGALSAFGSELQVNDAAAASKVLATASRQPCSWSTVSSGQSLVTDSCESAAQSKSASAPSVASVGGSAMHDLRSAAQLSSSSSAASVQ